MMDQVELFTFVVRAFLENLDGTRRDEQFTVSALATEAGVAEYHVTAAFEEMHRRKWVQGYLGGEMGTSRDDVERMRAFVNPLPPRKRTRAEVEHAVASALLVRIRANDEFTLQDIAADTSVHLGNVRRLFSAWVGEASGLREDGSGEVHWFGTSVPFLEALIDDPIEWGTDAARVEHHHHGDAVSGDKHHVTVQNSDVGAIATGARSVAIGTVASAPVSIEEVGKALRAANHALVEAEDSLVEGEHEEIHQLLRMLKSVQIDMSDLAESQRKAKVVLDALYASGEAEKLRGGISPAAKTVIHVLLGSPVFAEVVKALVTGGIS